MTALFITLYALFHLSVGGFSFQKIQTVGKAKCKYNRTGNCDGDCGHAVAAFLSIIVWPAVFPVLFGSHLANNDKPSRVERRRDKELAEARHQTMLSEERARESAALDRELSKYK